MASGTAMLILDMINTFDYPDGAALAREAKAIAPAIARAKRHFVGARGLCVYVNDNFGRWQSDFRGLVQAASQSKGAPILDYLMPTEEDLFILKPKHSAFFQTPLPQLLEQRRIRRLVIAGIASEACVMATALDAHMHEFEVRAPSNLTASGSKARKAAALLLMRHSDIDTRAWTPSRSR